MDKNFLNDSPILRNEMNGHPLAYPDNSATTQKPQNVVRSICGYYGGCNANPHRGVYELSVCATKIYEEARRKVADFLHAKSAREIIFTKNATESLNLIAYSYGLNNLRGVRFEEIERIEHDLTTFAIAELKRLPYVELYGSDAPNKIGIVTFNVKDVHPHDVATILDAEGVAIRASHHCAQPLMKYLGQNATCRASFYFYNTRHDVERLIAAIQKVRGVMRLA